MRAAHSRLSGSDLALTYYCFIDSRFSNTPHMEALDADSLEQAKAEARRLMSQHASAVAARIFLDDDEVAVLQRGTP